MKLLVVAFSLAWASLIIIGVSLFQGLTKSESDKLYTADTVRDWLPVILPAFLLLAVALIFIFRARPHNRKALFIYAGLGIIPGVLLSFIVGTALVSVVMSLGFP